MTGFKQSSKIDTHLVRGSGSSSQHQLRSFFLAGMKGLIFFVFVLGLLISAPPVSSCNPAPDKDQETTTQPPQDDDGSGEPVPDQEPQDDDDGVGGTSISLTIVGFKCTR